MAKASKGGAATVAEPEPPVFDPSNPTPDDGEPETTEETSSTGGTREPPSRYGQKFAPRQDTNDFWEWLRSHTEADWQQMEFYLYRRAPVTDRLAGGNPVKYVTKYGQAVDMEVIKREHGSGIYKALVNKLMVVNGKEKSQTIRSLVFEIEDPNYPPNVPPGDWVDDARNKRWAWAKPGGAAAAAGGQQQQQNPMVGVAELFKSVLDAVTRLRPELPKDDRQSVTSAIVEAMRASQAQTFELVKGKAGGWEPQQIVALVTAVAPLLKPAAPAADVNTAIVTMLQEANKELREELRELRRELRGGDAGAAGGSATNMLLRAAIKKFLDGSEAGPRDWKEMMVDVVGQHLPRITDMIGNRAAAAAAQAQPPAPRRPPVPATLPAPANPANGGAAAPAANPANGASPDPKLAEAIDVVSKYGGFMMNAFVQGSTGEDFAAAVVNMVGFPVYRRIANLGGDTLLEAIRNVPELAAEFQGLETDLAAFIADFIHFGEDDPNEEEPPEPEPQRKPAGPRPVPKAKEKAASAAASSAEKPS